MITREDDGGSIADQLERAGAIGSATWFNILTVLDGNRGALKRGEYAFKAGVSMNDIENELIAHRVVRYKLTIPEGLTSEQVVDRLRDDTVLTGEVRETPREGSLMPDTYYFERGDTRLSILSRMAKIQAKTIDEIWKTRSPDLPIKSPWEMLTLASIVEKETGKTEERPRVAGVFINRLEKHMRLGSDPTIVYGLVLGKGTLGRSITKADLNQPTPYNTYLIDGLPPGPICNPGRAALEAVAKPVKSKDLYFVADGTGGHAFAETLDQHQKNVAHWRQIEKDVKDKLAPDATPGPQFAVRSTRSIRGSLAPLSRRSGTGARLGSRPSGKIGADRNAKDAALLVAPGSNRSRKRTRRRQGAAGNLRAETRVGLAPPFRSSAVWRAHGAGAGTGAASILARLSKIGADRNAKDAALASLSGPGFKTIEELGAVVAGVNDGPAEGFTFGNDDPPATGAGSVGSAPLSPAMLADQKAREAKYGTVTLAATTLADVSGPPPAQASPGTASGHPRIYDASEGTPLDPLLNKTYDLSYAKVVPADPAVK